MITRIINHLIATQKNLTNERAALIEILSEYQLPIECIQITNELEYQERQKSIRRRMRETTDEDSILKLKTEAQPLYDYLNDRFSISEIDFIKNNTKTGDQLALILFGIGTGIGRYNFINDLDRQFLQSIIQNGNQLRSILSLMQTYVHNFIFEKLTINHLKKIIKDVDQLCHVLSEVGLNNRSKLINDLGIDFLRSKISNQHQLDSISIYIGEDEYPTVLNQLNFNLKKINKYNFFRADDNKIENNDLHVSDKEMASSAFGQGSNTAKMLQRK